jgi:hypothetical protein
VVSCFRRVLELEPEHGGGNYYLAVGLLAQGSVQECRRHLDRALAAGFSPEPEFLKALEKEEGPSTGSQGDRGSDDSGPREMKEETSGDIHTRNDHDRSR